MLDLVSNVCKAKELVLDTCADTLGTAKICLRLLDHQRFVVHGKDSACFHDSLLSVVEVYLEHFLSPDSDIACSKEVVEANTEIMKEMAAPASRRSIDSWSLPPGLFCAEVPCAYNVFFGNAYKSRTLFERASTTLYRNGTTSSGTVSTA